MRRLYHRKIADLIADLSEVSETQVELVAYHCAEAGYHDKAMGFWYKAGQNAIQHSANLEAISHATKGLELLKSIPSMPVRLQQELDFQTILATALTVTRGFAEPEVKHTYDRVRELCQRVEDTPQLFPVLWGIWLFDIARAELQTARRTALQYKQLAEALANDTALIDAHYMLGATSFYLGELLVARQAFEYRRGAFDDSYTP